jgi:hypothetical protein
MQIKKYNTCGCELYISHKIYKKNKFINFLPTLSAVDICTDELPYKTIDRMYSFYWMTFHFSLTVPCAPRGFKKGWYI